MYNTYKFTSKLLGHFRQCPAEKEGFFRLSFNEKILFSQSEAWICSWCLFIHPCSRVISGFENNVKLGNFNILFQSTKVRFSHQEEPMRCISLFSTFLFSSSNSSFYIYFITEMQAQIGLFLLQFDVFSYFDRKVFYLNKSISSL